jgi:hypothetical protein
LDVAFLFVAVAVVLLAEIRGAFVELLGYAL